MRALLPRLRPALFAGAALAACLLPNAAFAAIPADDPWAGAEVIEETELADLRGGFTLPNGQEMNFGATVRTYAGGALALQTELILTDTGALIEQTIGELGRALTSLTPEEREDLGLTEIGDAGVVIADESGVTALVQEMSEGSLQNIILNTASGRDLRQEIDVTITLENYNIFEAAITNELLGMRITDDVSYALTSAAAQ